MRKVFIALVMGLTLVFLSGAALAATWHAPVEGVPQALLQWDTRGYFIWHDNDGMHLRVRAMLRPHTFTGVIQTDGQFISYHDKQLEPGDYFTLDSDHNTLRFKLSVVGGVDGIDFKILGGTYLRFDLGMNGYRVNPTEIFLGEDNWQPSLNHFVLRR